MPRISSASSRSSCRRATCRCSGAARAAYFGKKVALIEKEEVLGGASVNTGTLPSKTLRETALYLSGFRQRGLHGVDIALRRAATVDEFLFREERVIAEERQRIA